MGDAAYEPETMQVNAPKNVLLLVADDLGKQLGCYGAKTCQTPHIDQLAAEGTRFTKAFASTASCSASRSTIYTGLHTHQNGQYGLNGSRHHFTTFENVETAPAIMKKLGYLTGIIGKVHVGPEAVYPWEVREESYSRDVAWVADRAGKFFEKSQAEARPFYLTIGFIDPHRDWTRSGFGNDDQFGDGVERKKYRPEDVEVPDFLTDVPGVRQEFASYYESISRMDQGVGFILQKLRNLGLYDDTLVIFLSDNGPPFLNSKTTLYDAGVSLPLIVRQPGLAPAVSPNMISYVDILPTILDFTGHGSEFPGSDKRRLGRSFLPILTTNEELAAWGEVYGSHTFHEITNYWPTRFVRTRRYKYHRNIAWRLDFPFAADLYGSLAWEDIRNADTNPSKKVGNRPLRDYFFRPAETLYDLEKDPYEVENLAQDAGHAGVLAELRTKMEAWQRRSEDPWLYRDGISVMFIQHHLDEGMVVPDRWDMDPEQTDSRGAGLAATGLKEYQRQAWGTDTVSN